MFFWCEDNYISFWVGKRVLEFINNGNNLTDLEAKNLNMQSLAFVGDSVHTLFVRTKLILKHDAKSNQLHTLANSFVKASGQSTAIDELIKTFSEEELEVYKRARNYKTQNLAKNAKLSDYKKATGFEALLGYLYLTNQTNRLMWLLQESYRLINEETKN